MITFLWFFFTAVVSIFLIASSALTAALGISLAHDGLSRRPVLSTMALFCESAGIVMTMFGLVFVNSDPIAQNVIVSGALFIALGVVIGSHRGTKALEPFLHQLQIRQYCGALACLAILTLVRGIEAIIG